MLRTLVLAVITARAALPGTAGAITATLALPPLTVPAAGGRARRLSPGDARFARRQPWPPAFTSTEHQGQEDSDEQIMYYRAGRPARRAAAGLQHACPFLCA